MPVILIFDLTIGEALCVFFIVLIMLLILINRYLNSDSVEETQRLETIAAEHDEKVEDIPLNTESCL